jgi:hypothetical protein
MLSTMPAPRWSTVVLPIGLVLLLDLAGCAPPVSRGGFDAPDSASRAYAIERAAGQRDLTKLQSLVEQLDADDPLVRMMAITTLERLTGQTHGYRHYDPPEAREPAIQRWQEAVRSAAEPPAQAMRN